MACKADVERGPWITILWDIMNYSHNWQKTDEDIESPKMHIEENDILWQLSLCPRGGLKEDIYLSIYGKCNDGSGNITVESEFGLLTDSDSVLQMKSGFKKTFERKGNWIRELFLTRDEMMKIKRENCLSGHMLRVLCRLWRTDGKAVTPAAFFAKTVLSVRKIDVHWTIERFETLEPGQKVNFVPCAKSEDDRVTLNMEVNEEGEMATSLTSFYKGMKFLIFQVFLMDTKGYKIACGRREIFHREFKKSVICMLPYTKKYLMNNKNMYLEDDVLSLYLEFSWCDGFDLNKIEKISIGSNKNPKLNRSYSDVDHMDQGIDLKEDLKYLYTQGILTDVELRAAARTFHAHKAILSARSPVFRAMFTTDMPEKRRDCVDLPDLDDETVGPMLLFMYTNAVDERHWQRILKLFSAGVRFQIVALKNKCASLMKRSLCPSKVCEVLHLADMHGDDELKKAAQDYVLAHEEDVFSTNDWVEFTRNDSTSTLALDTLFNTWKRSTSA